jgi:hypothetical protein
MAHIAKSPHNSLKNNDRFKAHIAPFYLAFPVALPHGWDEARFRLPERSILLEMA